MSGALGHEADRLPGFYWVSVASSSPEIAHFVEGEWLLIEQPLVPPALLDQGEDE